MQMSLRLLSGENVSLAEEAEASMMYIRLGRTKQTSKKPKNVGRSFQKEVARERMLAWKQSLEIPVEKAKELLPFIINKLRALDPIENSSFRKENFPWNSFRINPGGLITGIWAIQIPH